MRAILIDDEQSNIENLQYLLEKHCPQVEILASSTRVEQGINLITQYHPDLVFLDIQMGDQTGFDVLKAVKTRHFEVIFITAFDQYGIQAIKFAALDYLLKPIDIDELMLAVEKAEKKIAKHRPSSQLDFLLQQLQKPAPQSGKIALPMQSEIRYISLTEIVRCEADNTYTHFILENGERILVSKPLKEYADLLRPNGFLRTHQSHLVNPSYVKSWLKEDGGLLLLISGEKIPVSKPNKDAIKIALQG